MAVLAAMGPVLTIGFIVLLVVNKRNHTVFPGNWLHHSVCTIALVSLALLKTEKKIQI